MATLNNYLSLVKFSHTIFALPFALIGFFLAVSTGGHELNWLLLLKVVLCMVFARSAAMAFNRYADRHIDSQNQRTAIREIPGGIIRPEHARWFVIINSVLFIGVCWFINPICFYLSPVALVVILGYSYTKRFTSLCHFVLGLGLSLAPIGAWLAVTGEFALIPILFSLVVLFWVSGFDMIYALQDEDFDKGKGLQSIPVVLGKKGALRLSEALHIISAGLVFYIGWEASFHIYYWIGAGLFTSLLVYQHTLVKPTDLSKVNLAFFTTNGIASVVFCCFVLLELFLNS